MNAFNLVELTKKASEKFDINNIDSEYLVDFTYNTLSMETKYLTHDEVRNIVTHQSTESIDDKKIIFVENQLKAFSFITNLVKDNVELTEDKLKDLHQILMEGFSNGGLYRNVDISINGSNHTPCHYLKIYDRMETYFINLKQKEDDVLEQISYAHLQLCKIHPFLDGNGRLARLVLNYFLMKHRLAPIAICYKDKEQYFNCLEEYKVNKNSDVFKEYLIKLENEYLK